MSPLRVKAEAASLGLLVNWSYWQKSEIVHIVQSLNSLKKTMDAGNEKQTKGLDGKYCPSLLQVLFLY